MKVSIKVTDHKKYFESVKKVTLQELEALNAHIYKGSVKVITTEDKMIHALGVVNADEFEEEYGFILE